MYKKNETGCSLAFMVTFSGLRVVEVFWERLLEVDTADV